MTTPKIACPKCQGYRSRVINTRPLTREDGVYRRRECLDCRKRFSTAEVVVVLDAHPPRKARHHNI
jgi:transcriptional regulator NrdR family protein